MRWLSSFCSCARKKSPTRCLSSSLALPRASATVGGAIMGEEKTLRAGINLSNFLLVTGRTDQGTPVGVAPDLAAALAECLGAKLVLVPYENPGLLADAAARGEFDVGFIGSEPERAKVMRFTRPYVEIEATYLVRTGEGKEGGRARDLTAPASVDAPGVRIAVSARSAYDLWLSANLKHAELTRTSAPGLPGSLALFLDGSFDALAGLRPWLTQQLNDPRLSGRARVLDGKFTAVQQSIGTPRAAGGSGDSAGGEAVAEYLESFVGAAVASGHVAGLIEKHGVKGKLSVADGHIIAS